MLQIGIWIVSDIFEFVKYFIEYGDCCVCYQDVVIIVFVKGDIYEKLFELLIKLVDLYNIEDLIFELFFIVIWFVLVL